MAPRELAGPGAAPAGRTVPLEAAWPWEDDEGVDEDDPRIDAVFTHGSVVLGSDDGQSFWLLVTAGPRRGEIWMVSDVGAIPVPAADAWGFAEWVERWQAGDDWWA